MARRLLLFALVALAATLGAASGAGAQSSDPRAAVVHRVTTSVGVVIHDHDSLSADEHCEFRGGTDQTLRPADGVAQLGIGVPEVDYHFASGPFRNSSGSPMRFVCDEYALCFSSQVNANGLSPQGDANVQAYTAGMVRVTLPYTFEDVNGPFLLGDPPPCIGDEVLGSGTIVLDAWVGHRACYSSPPLWVDGQNRIQITDFCITNDHTLDPPVAKGSVRAATGGAAPLTASFDATASYDPDGYLVAYEWDFGDGNHQVTTTPSASHTYAVPGTYHPTLTVRDHTGLTDRTALSDDGIRVSEPDPTPVPDPDVVARIDGPSRLPFGDRATFDASASTSRVGPIAEYHWDFGDGRVEVSTDPKIDHRYATPGVQVVALTVVTKDSVTATASHWLVLTLDTDLDEDWTIVDRP